MVQEPVNRFLLEIFTLIVENIVDNLLSMGQRLVFKDYFQVRIIVQQKRFCERMQKNKYPIYHLWSVRIGEIFFEVSKTARGRISPVRTSKIVNNIYFFSKMLGYPAYYITLVRAVFHFRRIVAKCTAYSIVSLAPERK